MLGGKDNQQIFLGEGSYGCVWHPGITCKGNQIKKKNIVNKIQEINFYSKNELYVSKIVKNIKNYHKYFVPIKNYCIVEFNNILKSSIDVNKCQNLFEDYINDYTSSDQQKLLKNKYYMFYINYINNLTLKEYFIKNSSFNSYYFNKYIYNYLFLLKAINILYQNNIIHNDLHYNNILYNLDKDLPCIIDFGLSFHTKKLYLKNKSESESEFELKSQAENEAQTLSESHAELFINKNINYKNLQRFFFDFRIDSYNHLIEKRFISFFTYNYNESFKIKINNNHSINKLDTKILQIFIDDAYDTIFNNPEIKFIFNEKELASYKKALYTFYKPFLNKKTYYYYSDIVYELLPYVFKFNDLYSLSISFILIYYKINKDTSNTYNFVFILLSQLFKKILYPLPEYRIDIAQFISILEFLLNYIKTNNEYTSQFDIEFEKLLVTINLDYATFFNKEYAFIDFSKIFTSKNFNLLKKII